MRKTKRKADLSSNNWEIGNTEWLIKEIKKLGWVKEDFEIKKHRKKVM